MTNEYIPTQIYIGYWANKDGRNHVAEAYGGQVLTLPVENSLPVHETVAQNIIIARLKSLMETGYMAGYRGWSTCRICGKHNGTKELEIIRGRIKYCIPEGYVHYLEDHNVAYDPKLLEVI